MTTTLTSIAPLTSLTTDVGVVEVRPYEVVGLLSRGTSHPTASRSSEGKEGEAIRLI